MERKYSDMSLSGNTQHNSAKSPVQCEYFRPQFISGRGSKILERSRTPINYRRHHLPYIEKDTCIEEIGGSLQSESRTGVKIEGPYAQEVNSQFSSVTMKGYRVPEPPQREFLEENESFLKRIHELQGINLELRLQKEHDNERKQTDEHRASHSFALHSLESKLKHTMNEKCMLEGEIKNYQAQNRSLLGEKKELVAMIRELEQPRSRSQKCKEKLNTLKEYYQNLMKLYRDCEPNTELLSLRNRLRKKELVISQLCDTIESYNNKETTEQRITAELCGEQQEIIDENTYLREVNGQHIEEYSRLIAINDKITRENEELSETVLRLQSESNSFSSQLTEIAGAYSELNQNQANLDTLYPLKIEKLRNERKTHKKELKFLKSAGKDYEIDLLQEEPLKREQKLKKSQETENELHSQVESLTIRLTILKDSYIETESISQQKINKLERELRDIQEISTSRSYELQKKENESSILAYQLEELKKTIRMYEESPFQLNLYRSKVAELELNENLLINDQKEAPFILQPLGEEETQLQKLLKDTQTRCKCLEAKLEAKGET